MRAATAPRRASCAQLDVAPWGEWLHPTCCTKAAPVSPAAPDAGATAAARAAATVEPLGQAGGPPRPSPMTARVALVRQTGGAPAPDRILPAPDAGWAELGRPRASGPQPDITLSNDGKTGISRWQGRLRAERNGSLVYESGEHSHRTFFNGVRVVKRVTIELELHDLISFGGISRTGPDGRSIVYRVEGAEVDQESPAPLTPLDQEGPKTERAGARADGAVRPRRRGAPRDMTPAEGATLRRRVERFGRVVKRNRPETPTRGPPPQPTRRVGDGSERSRSRTRFAMGRVCAMAVHAAQRQDMQTVNFGKYSNHVSAFQRTVRLRTAGPQIRWQSSITQIH